MGNLRARRTGDVSLEAVDSQMFRRGCLHHAWHLILYYAWHLIFISL